MKAPKPKFALGDKVKHTVPSMLYGNTGIIVADAGNKYGIHYSVVEYGVLKHRTAFADFVLVAA